MPPKMLTIQLPKHNSETATRYKTANVKGDNNHNGVVHSALIKTSRIHVLVSLHLLRISKYYTSDVCVHV